MHIFLPDYYIPIGFWPFPIILNPIFYPSKIVWGIIDGFFSGHFKYSFSVIPIILHKQINTLFIHDYFGTYLSFRLRTDLAFARLLKWHHPFTTSQRWTWCFVFTTQFSNHVMLFPHFWAFLNLELCSFFP